MVTALLILASCGPAHDADEPRWVSLIQLIANPEHYHQQQVNVVGVLSLDFEGTALYLGEADAAYGLATNGIWLSFDRGQEDGYQELAGSYVMLEGRFSARDHGHFGLFRGAIGDITNIRPLPTVEELRRRQMGGTNNPE